MIVALTIISFFCCQSFLSVVHPATWPGLSSGLTLFLLDSLCWRLNSKIWWWWWTFWMSQKLHIHYHCGKLVWDPIKKPSTSHQWAIVQKSLIILAIRSKNFPSDLSLFQLSNPFIINSIIRWLGLLCQCHFLPHGPSTWVGMFTWSYPFFLVYMQEYLTLYGTPHKNSISSNGVLFSFCLLRKVPLKSWGLPKDARASQG